MSSGALELVRCSEKHTNICYYSDVLYLHSYFFATDINANLKESCKEENVNKKYLEIKTGNINR